MARKNGGKGTGIALIVGALAASGIIIFKKGKEAIEKIEKSIADSKNGNWRELFIKKSEHIVLDPTVQFNGGALGAICSVVRLDLSQVILKEDATFRIETYASSIFLIVPQSINLVINKKGKIGDVSCTVSNPNKSEFATLTLDIYYRVSGVYVIGAVLPMLPCEEMPPYSEDIEEQDYVKEDDVIILPCEIHDEGEIEDEDIELDEMFEGLFENIFNPKEETDEDVENVENVENVEQVQEDEFGEIEEDEVEEAEALEEVENDEIEEVENIGSEIYTIALDEVAKNEFDDEDEEAKDDTEEEHQYRYLELDEEEVFEEETEEMDELEEQPVFYDKAWDVLFGREAVEEEPAIEEEVEAEEEQEIEAEPEVEKEPEVEEELEVEAEPEVAEEPEAEEESDEEKKKSDEDFLKKFMEKYNIPSEDRTLEEEIEEEEEFESKNELEAEPENKKELEPELQEESEPEPISEPETEAKVTLSEEQQVYSINPNEDIFAQLERLANDILQKELEEKSEEPN